MEINKELEYFMKSSDSLLASLAPPTVPRWTKINDQRQPAFWSEKNTQYKYVGERNPSTPIKVGDQFFVTYSVHPAVRLDGNILVKFNNDKTIVLREEDETKSFITGMSRWIYIQKARAALGENLVKVEITATYECVHTYIGISDPYKTVGNITVKKIKI